MKTTTAKKATAKKAVQPTAKKATAKKNTAPAKLLSSLEDDDDTDLELDTDNETETTADNEQKESPFEKLFINLLKDIYWAEQHLVDALRKMCDAATTDVLQSAFEDHLYITQKHVGRLEKVFSLLGETAEAKKCEVMEALVKEAEQVIAETKEGSMTRDAGLIIAAQKVEHYEIAAYGSLVQVALTLGHDRVADILEKTLWEEEDTDGQLTEIAETAINPKADDEENTDEEENDNEDEDEDDDDSSTSMLG